MNQFRIFLLSAVISVCALSQVKAQDIQFLYDTERGCVTTTFEMFRPDAFGSTYFFVDFDANPKVSGTYWEITRDFNFWQDSEFSWLSVQVEYAGGMNAVAGSFNNSWLGGLSYAGHSKDYSKTWSLTALYKYIPGTVGLNGNKQEHNFQITGVWGIAFANGWCSFNGFFDFWREARPWQGTQYIFISEPQFWLNLYKIKGWEDIHLSIGGELELSANFVDKGLYVCPALGLKWTFN